MESKADLETKEMTIKRKRGEFSDYHERQGGKPNKESC